MNDRIAAFIGAPGSKRRTVVKMASLVLLSLMSFGAVIALYPVRRMGDLKRSAIRPQYSEVKTHRSMRGGQSTEIIIHTDDRSYILRDIVYRSSYDERPIVAALTPEQPCIIWTEDNTNDSRPYIYGIVTPTIGIDPSIGISAYDRVRYQIIFIVGLGVPFITMLAYRGWRFDRMRKPIRRKR